MPESTPLARRPAMRFAAGMAISAAAAAAAGIATVVFGSAGLTDLLVTAGAGAFAMLVGAWTSVVWWRTLDEAAREAHKWAWWWGGSGGLAVGGVVLITLVGGARGGHDPAILSGDPIDLVVAGAIGCALFQLAGYGLAWVGWWLARR